LVDLKFDLWFCAVGLGGLRGGFWVNFSGCLAHCGLRGGSWWVAGWVTVGLGGWQWWFPFLVDSGGFGCGFFLLLCFTLLQTNSIEYFPKHFPRIQTNTEKRLFFLKSFAFENILQCKMFHIETNGALK
jgi:hypothetical protein